MTLEDIERMTVAELRRAADKCIANADATDWNHQRQTAERLHAQLYLNEIEKRQSAKTARRDFWLEMFVIGLIALELLASVIGTRLALREGKDQADMLTRMDESTRDTAKAVAIMNDQLKPLLALNDMGENLSGMNTTIGNQLKIIRAEQTERIAEANRKPDLEVWANSFTIPPGYHVVKLDPEVQALIGILRIDDATRTESSLTLYLRNVGTAPAVNVTVLSRAPSPVVSRCVDFPSLFLELVDKPEFKPCDMGFAIIPPIMPRPRSTTRGGSLTEAELEYKYDFPVRINLTVPTDIRRFILEIVIKSDQTNPVRYRVECFTAS
jgi:hypothetical protein